MEHLVNATASYGGLGGDTIGGGNGDDVLWVGGGDGAVYAGTGNDVIQGVSGGNVIWAGTGDDTMTGGTGNNGFVFTTGNDVVADFDAFNALEKVDLSFVSEIANFIDLSTGKHLSQLGLDAVISDLVSNTLTLNGVAVADLGIDDFLF